ncbi:site-specific integrase [Gordonia sp. QH-12]|uniref:tyrosine-type recombinase/integrase n=1 Tax=Gordonia sp. QH-12 TaxID=1437876 RepID=UPI0009EE37F2|nr:site-specific integrase [Gordonia sp. QH-12]
MIEKLPSGKWRVRLYAGSDYVASRTFALKRDARDWETRQNLLIKSGSWSHPDDASMLYRDWLDEWLAMQGGAGKTRSKRKWAAGYARDALGRLPLSAVSPSRVKKTVAAIRDEKSRDTAYQVLVVIRGSMRAAVDEGLLPRDPTATVKLPKARPNEPRPLSHVELWRLSEMMSTEADRIMILTMGYSGLRWGEISALRPDQVSERGLRVTHAYSEVDGKLILGDVKDHEARSVPLPTRVRDELLVWADKRSRRDLLFVTSRETPYYNGNWTRSKLRPAAARAGLPKVTPHNLRDTAASLAIDAGASVMAVSRMLGHENASTTLTHYASLFPDTFEGLITRLDSAIEATLSFKDENGGERRQEKAN